MKRYFNVAGACNPKYHYMVDLEPRLKEITDLVERGDYFTINRARQYGKTTTLHALKQYLKEDYLVVSLDFQLFTHGDFESEAAFVSAFARETLAAIDRENALPEGIEEKLNGFAETEREGTKLAVLFAVLSRWCAGSEKPVVLMIDEVDSATNNQVFVDFLSQLRGYYIHREERPIFQSLILTGVYDIKNIRHKIKREEGHKNNSPWNIAADFRVDMSLRADGIAGMLEEYEADHRTGMDVEEMAGLLYAYTSGYPFLVSRLCKIMDEEMEKYGNHTVWSRAGFLQAVKLLLNEKNMLFESMVNKLYDYPELKDIVYDILFGGKEISYNALIQVVDMAAMFGFIRNQDGIIAISNRIFESIFYNFFLTSMEMQNKAISQAAVRDKNQFVREGRLDMELILEKFVAHFDELYGDQPDKFKEEDGRRYFLLYLKPIINGVGNYYIEARTRNMERTDVIVDFLGTQYVIELKIWRGAQYDARGREQLAEYLSHYGLKKGYLLSFNFNKNKKIGVNSFCVGDKVIVEAMV